MRVCVVRTVIVLTRWVDSTAPVVTASSEMASHVVSAVSECVCVDQMFIHFIMHCILIPFIAVISYKTDR